MRTTVRPHAPTIGSCCGARPCGWGLSQRDSVAVLTVRHPVVSCEPRHNFRSREPHEMENATVITDNSTHEIATSLPATSATGEVAVLRPTEIRLCKYMTRMTVSPSRADFPYFIGQGRHEI